jgi:hypothetical protein
MAEELIDSYVNRQGISSDTQFIVDELNQALTLFKKLDGFKINLELSKSSKDLVNVIKQISDAQGSLTGTTKDLLNMQKKQAENELKLAKTSKELAAAKLNEAKAGTETAKAKAIEEKARLANAKAIEKEQAAANKKSDLSSRPIESIPFEIKTAGENDIENLKKTGEAVSDLNKAEVETIITANEFAESQKLAGEAASNAIDNNVSANVVVYNDSLEKLTGTLAENESLMKIYKGELSTVQSELKLMDKTTSTSEKSTEKYRNKVSDLTSTETKLKAEIKDLNVTIKNQNIANTAAAGSVDQLKARYALLIREIDRGGESFRQSSIGQKLVIESNTISTQLKKIEGDTGRFQRNVGNYGSAITNFAGKAFSAIRRFAYLVPGFGIAGIIGLLSDSIVGFFKNIFNGSKSFDAARVSAKSYADTLKQVNEQAIKVSAADVTKLELFRDILTDVTKTQKERTEALNAYNKVADDSNKIDVSQLSNLTLINDKISQQISLIEKRAFSRAAESILGEKAEALLLAKEAARVKAELDFEIELANGMIVINKAFGAAFDDIEKNRVISQKINSDKRVKQTQAEFEGSKKALYGLIDVEGFVSEEVKKVKEKKEKESADDRFKNKEEERKSLFEIEKRLIQDRIDASSLIIADDKKSFNERLMAAQTFYDNSLLLINKQKDFEITSLNNAEVEEKRKAREVKNAKVRNELILSIERAFSAKRKLVYVNTNTAINNLEVGEGKKRVDLIDKNRKEAAEHQVALHEENLQEIQQGFDQALVDLDKSFAKKEIKEKEYNERKLRLQIQSQAELLKEDIKYAKAQLEIAQMVAEASGKQEDIDKVISAKNKLTSLEIKLAGIVADYQIKRNGDVDKSNDELQAKRLRHLEELKNVAEEVYSIIGEFINAGTEREKNAIQEQIDALDEKKAKDIEVANQTITNATDRANAIAVIEARAEAQRQQLEIRKRQAQERQAKFEKAATIASIIMETSLAVIRALGDKTTPSIFGRIAGAVIIGAIGAAKLAVAIATPIPKYKHGKKANEPYEGPAIVGDGGKSELIERADGRMEVTPAKATLTYLASKDVVFPDAREALKGRVTNINISALKPQAPSDTTASEVKIMRKEVVKAIKNIPQPILKTDGNWKKYMRSRGHSFTEYLNNNL